MTQYVYETTIFEIRRQAMQDALGSLGAGDVDTLIAGASAILDWYLHDLPKTTLGTIPEQKP